MTLLVLYGTIFAWMISLIGGLFVLSLPPLKQQRPHQTWDVSTAICCLITIVLMLIAKTAFRSSPTGVDSMVEGVLRVSIAFLAGGAALGFGLTAVAGGLLMIAERVSRWR